MIAFQASIPSAGLFDNWVDLSFSIRVFLNEDLRYDTIDLLRQEGRIWIIRSVIFYVSRCLIDS
jgi:hypothetical protein